MKKQILIYGGGGLGRETLSLIRALPEWEPIGFVDDGIDKGMVIANLPVHGGIDFLASSQVELQVILAIGNPRAKKLIAEKLKGCRVTFPVLVHPTSVLQDRQNISLGAGTVVGAGAVLTTNIIVGQHVLINLNATIGHDCNIGAWSSIMPGVHVSGNVIVEEEVLVGSGANIINNIRVGKGARVGMGAAVINNVADGLTVVGVPAKSLTP